MFRDFVLQDPELSRLFRCHSSNVKGEDLGTNSYGVRTEAMGHSSLARQRQKLWLMRQGRRSKTSPQVAAPQQGGTFLKRESSNPISCRDRADVHDGGPSLAQVRSLLADSNREGGSHVLSGDAGGSPRVPAGHAFQIFDLWQT